jgi:UDP:flavonoid glycosyltransferase YjiC (YdhE family)
MRIARIAPGSRGDVQPYIALGKGLKNAGNIVRFVTHQNFEGLINSHGLESWPVEGDVQDIVQNKEMRERIEKGNFLFLMAQMAKEAQRGALLLAEAGSAASQGMDIVLTGMGLTLSHIRGYFRASPPWSIMVALEQQPLVSEQAFLQSLSPSLVINHFGVSELQN